MAANNLCNQIHEKIMQSGLHFVINQTPFSSYITIRKKFVRNAPDKAEDLDSFQNNDSQIDSLKHYLESLKLRNQHLAEALVDREEELETTKNQANETKSRLHNIIDDLEKKLKICQNENQVKVSELKCMLDYKEQEIKHLEDKTSELGNVVEAKKEKIEMFEQQLRRNQAKQEREHMKKAKKESQKAKKVKKSLQDPNPNLTNLSEVENNNTLKEEELVGEEPPCDVCKGLTNEHADNCDNLRIKLKDYVPVKMKRYPIMPFSDQIRQEAVEKYMGIFGNHKCMECKEWKVEVSGWNSIPYCRNNFIQFTLFNAEFS